MHHNNTDVNMYSSSIVYSHTSSVINTQYVASVWQSTPQGYVWSLLSISFRTSNYYEYPFSIKMRCLITSVELPHHSGTKVTKTTQHVLPQELFHLCQNRVHYVRRDSNIWTGCTQLTTSVRLFFVGLATSLSFSSSSSLAASLFLGGITPG